MSKIVIIQGHPDPSEERLCRALAKAYGKGAQAAGHSVITVDPARMDFPLLSSQKDWDSGIDGTPPTLLEAQAEILSADHFVLIYPLWLGTMPARLKGFLEQVLRPGVALSNDGQFPGGLMKGKSARVVVTMGMPAPVYRWFFFAHSLKSLSRNILGFVGIHPVRSTLIGLVGSIDPGRAARLFAKMETFGKLAK